MFINLYFDSQKLLLFFCYYVQILWSIFVNIEYINYCKQKCNIIDSPTSDL